MRLPSKNSNDGVFSQDFRYALPVSFTSDAINHLSSLEHNCFDIRDWVWHIEVVNGEKYCIITDRLQQPFPGENG